MSEVLAALDIGDRFPWKLDRNGEPLRLTVVEVLGETSYRVRYPDGEVEALTDSR